MQVRVGVAVIIINDDKILMGKRKNSHGSETWSLPGGHLEFGETPEDCAIREVKEETDLNIKSVKRGSWTNDFFADNNKHYITVFMLAQYEGGEPKLMEPDKCYEWRWCHYDDLPRPLFLPISNLVQQGKYREFIQCLK